MEQIKELVRDYNNNSFKLSAQMIEVVQNAVARLLEQIDDVVQKGWDKDRAMAYLSINEIRNTVRLIDMGFGPLFKEMSNTVDQLHNDSLELFNMVYENKKADVGASTK